MEIGKSRKSKKKKSDKVGNLKKQEIRKSRKSENVGHGKEKEI